MKIAILLLCHESPELLADRLASPFFASEDVKVYIHYDAQRSEVDFTSLRLRLPDTVRHHLLQDRVACGWGTYSLVEATHRLMKAALADMEFRPDYLALISGSCAPIRPLSSLQEFLRRRRGVEFIQTVDISQRSWVKGGLERERFQYYFPLNFRHHREWFDRLTGWQRRLGIQRQVPDGLRVHFGSQWFCLTRATVAQVAQRLDEPALRTFFTHSWIPDEFAIQTLVAAVQRPALISGFNLTYYEFDDQGRPLVLENDHWPHLQRQPFFFARKLAPGARRLREAINDHVAQPERDLSYFNQVGQATNDYQRFLARALNVGSARSRIGTVADAWRGVMDRNQRRYYVLYASSHAYLMALTRLARQHTPGVPVFDFVFDPESLVPAAETGGWRGVQSGMRAHRDYEPGAFLHELVNIDADRPTAFAIDPAPASWARDYVVWDPNATLVNCDPLGIGKIQRAEAALRGMNSAAQTQVFARTLEATESVKWLPLEFFAQQLAEKKSACHAWNLAHMKVDQGAGVIQALLHAAASIDPWDHYARSDDAALARVHDVQRHSS